MTTRRGDGKARAVLAVLAALGLALVGVPFLLTPPALLELVLRDTVFAADLAGRTIQVRDDTSGSLLSATVRRNGNAFLAPIGRISSGPGSFTVELEGYAPVSSPVAAPPLQTVRPTVDLVPTFGRLEVALVNARRTNQPVEGILKQGRNVLVERPQAVVVVDLPPGRYRLAAEAAGFCPGERDVRVAERQVARVTFPLSPDVTGNEIARLVLDWGKDPRDLDAHFQKSRTTELTDPAHVFFGNKQGRNEAGQLFAQLDVDHLRSEGFETVTVFDSAAGDYDYYVHLYAGEGTLGGSHAQVEAFTRGCARRRYSVPAACGRGVWAVAQVRVEQGRPEFVELQRCEGGLSRAGSKGP